jgi:succinyl-CoA synthetase beta subunit
MATLDTIDHFGGKPANFLDVGGGASVEQMEKSMELCMLKKPKGIFINIFGGITRCDNIAQGLVDYIAKKSIEIPMVVRLIGTNESEGQKILEENNISTLPSMEECAKKIVEMIKCQ